jgi:hypothetical protein
MKKTKLAIERAVDGMVNVNSELKLASTFNEVDAIQGIEGTRDALNRTRTASMVVAESAVEARQTSEAIKRTADMRLAELLTKINAPEDVEAIAAQHGKTSRVEAHALKIVGGLPAYVRKAAEKAIKDNNRGSKNPVKSLAILNQVPPKKRLEAIAKLEDHPTLREAVLAVIPDFYPTPTPKPVTAPVVVPKWLLDYQAQTLKVVAVALKLRGAVEAAVKDPDKQTAIVTVELALTREVNLLGSHMPFGLRRIPAP